MYQYGKGVQKDEKKAFECYLQSATIGGHPKAYTKLAWMYANGIGVAVDPRCACEWYQRAALEGQDFALMALGYRYEKGDEIRGLCWDWAKAYQCMKAAAALKNDAAVQWLLYYDEVHKLNL